MIAHECKIIESSVNALSGPPMVWQLGYNGMVEGTMVFVSLVFLLSGLMRVLPPLSEIRQLAICTQNGISGLLL